MPQYFTQKTQDSIIKYNQTDCFNEKNKIFQNEINAAFEKMVESLIFSHKFRSKLQNYETLKHNVIGDLAIKLNRFDPNKLGKTGKPVKAYSFFNTVAKNFILMELQKEAKTESLQDLDNENHRENNSIESRKILEKFSVNDNTNERTEFMSVILDYLQKEQQKNLNTLDEKILDAIEFAFSNIYETGISNKKNLFLYLREFTGLTTAEISTFLNKFRGRFKQYVNSYQDGEL